MKPMRIKLRDEEWKFYFWTISKTIGGWDFTDHENYTRFSEGNWLTLVSRFKSVAENYGLTLMSELS